MNSMNNEFAFHDYQKITGQQNKNGKKLGIAGREFPFSLTHFIFEQQDLKNYMEEQQNYPLLLPDKHN